MECIECVSCSYVCPAKRPLTQGFKQMKQRVNALKREKAAQEKKKQEEALAAAEKKKSEETKASEIKKEMAEVR